MASSFDTNFCFPLPESIENDKVKLVPFVPSNFADEFAAASKDHPVLFTHLPYGPWQTGQEMTDAFLEPSIHRNPGVVLFAVLDKLSNNALAGTLGYLNSSAVNLVTEIGYVTILPAFQRTHVASNAVIVLMKYALDQPPAGLGLRRLEWRANSLNTKSIALAMRMGYQLDAVLRWDRVYPGGAQGKTGNGRMVRADDVKAGTVGRDTAILSVCWDDWLNGVREVAIKNEQRHK
ncbi:acyl-CoA N-acyltransferase [Schizophyllum amplum]|uniref:Acyl-CoA N-acyltransferase n=1 Tax=Schizophyllum amplum TaxID=97359 RepID=A0A550C862_9AGAR|nr:acyl-CoA N-acyltransferase [Auriculariopsis ampla]